MATTVLCSRCGTRNRAAMGHCRRCKAPLSGTSLGGNETVRGTPTSNLIDERWAIVDDAPQMATGWSTGTDVASGRSVLIRTLRPRPFANLTSVQLFDLARRRQDAAQQGLLDVVAVTERDDDVFMVCSFFDGQTLRALIADRPGFPLHVALHFFEDIIVGLQHLHQHGLVHGAMEPQTIWIDNESGSSMPAALVAGGVRARQPDGVAADYRGVARVLAAMLLGRAFDRSRRPARVIGAAIDQCRRRYGEEVSGALRQLFDVLVRGHQDGAASRRADIDAAVGRMGATGQWAMMAVGRAPFRRGSDADAPDARPEERPSSMIDISPFFIDQTPVTAGQYARYLRATDQAPPPGWSEHNDPGGAADRPVVFVTWQEAREYARWAGKRLLTEAEWEKAARGTDGRRYPWGDEPPSEELACYGGQPRPKAVGAHRMGQSVYGVLDMAGNVFEWVYDWFDAEYYDRAPPSDPRGPDEGQKRVLRGGSYAHPAFALRCATRGRYDPAARRANHSFRCGWSIR